MIQRALILASALLLAPIAADAPASERIPARQLSGANERPADLGPQAIGFYSRGCLAGGVAMPVNGPNWQIMRPSRNRNWGHPDTIAFLKWLAGEAAAKDGWPGLLIGDLSGPRGGPISGHASHQVGLDADIWLTPMPQRRLSVEERETRSATEIVRDGPYRVHEQRWTPAHLAVIRRAALHPRVERVLVGPGIKRKLCDTAGSDRAWLRKVRPFWGHNFHMHVRLACPPGASSCRRQDPPPSGDGCGSNLAWWFTAEPWRPGPARPRPELMLTDLPAACRRVFEAGDRPGTMTALEALGAAGGRAAPAPVPAAAAEAGRTVPAPPRPRPDLH